MTRSIIVTAAVLALFCLVTPSARGEETKGAISYKDAAQFIGQKKTVEGTITGTYLSSKGSGNLYLNFGDYKKDLSVKIPAADIKKFPSDAQTLYKGKKIEATGEVMKERGKLRLTVSDPADIKIVQ